MKTGSFQHLISSDVPVLIDFYADWCGPCKMQAPILKQLAEQMGGKVKIIKIDTDRNQALSAELNIRSIPTLMLYQNGKQLWRHSGVANLAQLKQVLQPYLQGAQS